MPGGEKPSKADLQRGYSRPEERSRRSQAQQRRRTLGAVNPVTRQGNPDRLLEEAFKTDDER